MEEFFTTLDKGYIRYGIDKINVIIDNNEKLWFSRKEAALALGYKNTKNALRMHVKSYDKKYLKKININDADLCGRLLLLASSLTYVVTKKQEY